MKFRNKIYPAFLFPFSIYTLQVEAVTKLTTMRKRRATLPMVYLSESMKGKRITFMRDNFDWIDFLPF